MAYSLTKYISAGVFKISEWLIVYFGKIGYIVHAGIQVPCWGTKPNQMELSYHLVPTLTSDHQTDSRNVTKSHLILRRQGHFIPRSIELSSH